MHDPKCRELAEYFLADYYHSEADANELAEEIQTHIEMWLTARGPLEKSYENRYPNGAAKSQ
jgi:hypothetical protein